MLIKKKTLFLISFFILKFTCTTSCVRKLYISPQQLLEDSFCLAKKVMDSGFEPTFLVCLWRGGAPVGMAITEYFYYKGKPIPNHAAVRVSAYNHDQLKKELVVYNLDYLVKTIKNTDRLLLVDDIIDSGSSILVFLDELKKQCGENFPKDIRIASVFYKPAALEKISYPVYCMHETKNWIVFPHEIEGMTFDDMAKYKGKVIADAVS